MWSASLDTLERIESVVEKLLFDASLILALKLRRLRLLYGNYIQRLTIYETLDRLWKEARLIKAINLEEAITIARALEKIVSYMNILSPTEPKKRF